MLESDPTGLRESDLTCVSVESDSTAESDPTGVSVESDPTAESDPTCVSVESDPTREVDPTRGLESDPTQEGVGVDTRRGELNSNLVILVDGDIGGGSLTV